jgi:hypothetical protein
LTYQRQFPSDAVQERISSTTNRSLQPMCARMAASGALRAAVPTSGRVQRHVAAAVAGGRTVVAAAATCGSSSPPSTCTAAT